MRKRCPPILGRSRVDVSDLAALWTLSVPLKWRQPKELLDTRSDTIAALLTGIEDRELADLTQDELFKLNDPESPEPRLWAEVRQIKGMGPTRTSKVLARKRPASFRSLTRS